MHLQARTMDTATKLVCRMTQTRKRRSIRKESTKTCSQCVGAPTTAKPFMTEEERLATPSLATTRCSRRMPSHAVQGESYRNNQNQSQTHFGASPTPPAQQPLADTREGAMEPFHRNLYNRQTGQRRNNALDRQKTLQREKRNHQDTEPAAMSVR